MTDLYLDTELPTCGHSDVKVIERLEKRVNTSYFLIKCIAIGLYALVLVQFIRDF